MRNLHIVFVCTSLVLTLPAKAGPSDAVAKNHIVKERGPHHKVIQYETFETNLVGNVVSVRTNIHSYTELQTGMHKKNNKGEWVETSDEIVLAPGGAAASDTAHQVFFAANANSAEAVQVAMPEGNKTLSSHVLCLSYFDTVTGSNAIIAELRDSIGQIIGTNQVLYTNALSGDCVADILYQNSRAGLEQNIILRTQPPSPAEYGISNAMLQVWTEFVSLHRPTLFSSKGHSGFSDEQLDFDSMKIGPGRAFLIGNNSHPAVQVLKQWIEIDGRTFLVEQIPVDSATTQLQELQPQSGGGGPQGPHGSVRPRPPKFRFAQTGTNAMKIAKLDLNKKPGFLLDYSLVTSATDFTFQADTTYYLSGAGTTLSGNTVFEGGCVLKYNRNAYIVIYPTVSVPTVTCRASAYRPIIFTAKDDQSIGETISGSSNAPSGYYGNPVLYMSGVTPPPSLTHIRISYASLGIELAPNSAEISDVQFVNCLIPIEVGGTVHLQNSLMTGCQTNIEFIANNASLAAENVTFSGSACLSQALGTNAALVLTNCILADITNLASGNVSLSGDTNGFWNSPTFGNMVTNTFYPFQTAGGGNFYLANGCNFLGAGTTYINTNLLAELRQKTTHPPVVLTGGVLASNDIALWPQVQRETNAPDLGFAYDPIDYELGAIVVTNPIQITLTPGTVIAGFGTNGIGRSLTVANGARFLASGTPIQPVRIVEYSTVQEHVPTNWNMPFYSILTDDIYENGSPPPACFNCRFTDFSAVANDGPQLGLTASRSDIRDCQFHGGTFATYATDTVTNCLFERTVTYIQPYSGTGKSVLENNLFFGGQFYFETSSGTNGVVRDNLFDRTTVYFNDVSYQGGYNAFVTNFDRIHPTNATDIILADTGYVPGPLGNYYYPTNGGNLSRLIDAGGTTADAVGLYQFTTVTNFASGVEIKEANSVVDVGFHYVAVDSNGNPIDTDGGGIADYMEDGNGNGLVDAGESDWTAGHGSDDYKNLLTPAYLRCEYRENPWGVDARPSITSTNAQRPRLYWIVKSDRRAERQLAYRVLVASSESNLASDYGDMWDSGKVYSDQTIHVEYNGTTLQSGMRLWWKVRTWDWYTGLPSPWSTNGFFQMGLLSTSDWNGVEWIGVNGYNPAKPSPMYRSQQFLLTNQVKNATVYVSAKGVYELWINGYRIGPNILAPEWTDYNQRIQYQTFDVAPYLTNGTLYSSNVMGAFVGEGWCYGPTDHGSPPFYGAKNPQFALRLNVTNTDGTVTNILTDSTWVCSTNGPIRFSSIYDGETYDATQEGASTNWSLTSYSPTTFTVPMTVSNVAGSQMASQPNEPRQITQLIRPIAMWNTSTNSGRVVTVFDMGQNMVGWCSLSLSNLSGLTGTTITLRHAERLLLDTNNYPIPSGNIDTNNLRDFFGHADQIESYILNGDQNRQFQPHFTYHGFRYVEVTSPLAIATNLSLGSVTGCVIHSAVPFTGGFCCYGTNSNSSINWVLQNGLINKLVTNGIWGIRGNLQGVFTACTQRAEREGYLYDEDIISQTACFDVDMSAFLTKWIRDIRDAQSYRHSSFGDWSYTDFAPWDNLLSVSYYDPCAQGSALIFPWRMFQNYGDTRALAEHYTSTTNYIGFLTNFCHAGSGSWDTTVWTEGGSVMVGDWATGDFFDWQSSGGAHPFKWPCGTNTPSPYHHALVYSPCWGTAWSAASLDFAARCSDVLKQVALSQGDTVSALHYSGDFQNFTNLAATARSAYTNSANGIVKFSSSIITNIGWNSQSDHVTALNLNMIPDGNRQDVLQLLLNTTYGISDYARDYPYGISTNHLSGGYFGAPKAMLELTRAGYTKKAYELLVDTNFPCWLHPVVNGHTTFWEGWNAYLPGPRTLGATYNDRGYYPQPLQSFNHLAFGAVGEWIWKVIGGINPDDSNPGFRNAIIKPEPGAGITNAFASFRSIRGPIITSWTNNPAVSNYILNVTVPANATASICLPSTNLTSITESGTWATNSPGVFSYYPTNWPGWTGGATVFSVGSGSYSFAITNISF